MAEYKRIPGCECSSFVDLNTVDAEHRIDTTKYWLNGNIYENGRARECTCHKKWRLAGRYDSLAKQYNLPTHDELVEMKFLGDNSNFQKLKSLPKIVKEHRLTNVLGFIHGPAGCQKTTSIAKLLYGLVLDGYTVGYTTYSDLVDKLVAKEDISELVSADWLIIDDTFEGGTITVKTSYNLFYNLILKRAKPTILCTDLSEAEIRGSTNMPFYNQTMLNKLFTKVQKYKVDLLFDQDVGKLQLTNGTSGTIDIWSL